MKLPIREHRWVLAEPPDPGIVARLAQEINVPEPISRMLVHRGIDDYEKARTYFRPSLEHLHDPFLMDGMGAAVDRVTAALAQREKIRVFGDYDVDGTNGAAMLYLFLRSLGAEATYAIPDRLGEGYGISRQAVERAHADGVTLFISVDCGITAVEQVAIARSLGMDVIVCDHHEPGERLPDAYAVLDPLKPGCPYPFKYLSGCGVGFKLLHGLARSAGKEEEIGNYLDFVALASTADIVPLYGENRVLVRFGMEAINTRPRPGIKALIESAGLQVGTITTGQVVFVIAPRINAVGRLGDATRAVRLLTATDPADAQGLAQVLEEENRNRRKIDEDTFAEAQALAETVDLEAEAALVLHQGHWHPGVIGIVASRMVERYYKPSIMMSTVDGVAKGSARSVSGFDIFRALKMCENKLIQFGGHKYAAGLTVEVSRLDEFREAFNDAVRTLMAEEMKTPEIRIDTEIGLREITPRFVRILREFAPFGPANMRPTFLTRNVEIVGVPRIVGRNHLRFKARQNGTVFDAIGFGLGHLLPKAAGGRRDVEFVFSIDEQEGPPRQGPVRPDGLPQLKVRDLR